VTLGELVIGALLILGLVTGVAAVAGLALNVIYMFSGSSGVNPAYAIVAVFLILAWRNAGYFGLDRFALPVMRAWLRPCPRMITPVASPPPAPVPVG
jgi:thiosulfate dehydrogenase [quinone] large subunit